MITQKKLKLFLKIVGIYILLSVTFSTYRYSVDIEDNDDNKAKNVNNKIEFNKQPKESFQEKINVQQVTKKGREILTSNTSFDDLAYEQYHLPLVDMEKLHNTKRIFYNRLPKCGSITFGNLVSRMSRINKFKSAASSVYDPPWITSVEQKKTAEYISKLREPFIYNRHLCLLDFEKFGYQMPVYINLVRHPLDRFVSSYYYQRSLHKKTMSQAEYDVDVNQCLERNFTHCTLYGTFIMVTYFCGQDPMCQEHTVHALEKAKQNAAKHYAVVGLTEDFETFLDVLDCVLPQYFKGARKAYKGKKANITKNKGNPLNDTNKEKLSNHMKLEIEFYYFLKARFYYLRDHLKTTCNLPDQ